MHFHVFDICFKCSCMHMIYKYIIYIHIKKAITNSEKLYKQKQTIKNKRQA